VVQMSNQKYPTELNLEQQDQKLDVIDDFRGDVQLVELGKQKVQDKVLELDNKEGEDVNRNSQDVAVSDAVDKNENSACCQYCVVFLLIVGGLGLILGAVLYFNDSSIFGIRFKSIWKG